MISAALLMILATPAQGVGDGVRAIAPATPVAAATSGDMYDAVATDEDISDIREMTQPTVFTWEGRQKPLVTKPGPGSVS
jgi:hypothetical protein